MCIKWLWCTPFHHVFIKIFKLEEFWSFVTNLTCTLTLRLSPFPLFLYSSFPLFFRSFVLHFLFLFPFSSVLLFLCCNVPIFLCSCVHLFLCSSVLRFLCSSITLFFCLSLLLCSLYLRFPVFLHLIFRVPSTLPLHVFPASCIPLSRSIVISFLYSHIFRDTIPSFDHSPLSSFPLSSALLTSNSLIWFDWKQLHTSQSNKVITHSK